MKVWKAQKKPIVVGMRLDDREDLLLQSAMSLAAKLQSPVELVHCLESTIGYSSAGEILPKANGQSPVLKNSWGEDRAKTMLNALGRATSERVDIHVHVERGDAAESLARIAREVGSGLIVCGMHDQGQPWAFQGLSTALSLAFYAPVPVLILPIPVAIDFEKPVGILISDSLGCEGWHVLESGLQLARYLDCSGISHAHVLKANAMDMETILQDMAESAKQGRLPRAEPVTAELLKKHLLQKINDELSYRFHNTSCCKALQPRYQPCAGIGDIDGEVNRMMEASGTRLVIMGRHQFYSQRRLALDHIPYRAVLERKAALLVIPNEEARSPLQKNEWDSRLNSDKDLSETPQRMQGNAATFW